MTSSLAKEIISGQLPDCSRAYMRSAWQHLVDTGEVWRMHQHYVNLATAQLAAGVLRRNVA